MTREELVARIKTYPALAVHFRSTTDNGICAHCVEKALQIMEEHPEMDGLINTITDCSNQKARIEAEIDKVTRTLRAELDENMQGWRAAEHRLYELRNATVGCVR